MQDESLVDLCKIIYRKHRDAIDLIVEYGMVGVGQQALEDFLAKDGEYEILYSSPSYVWFLPKSWSEIIPENGILWPHLKRRVSIVCWVEFTKKKIYVHFELSQMDNTQLRQTCAEKLKKAGFPIRKGALDENAKYSRFYGESRTVSDMTNEEEVRKIIEKLFRKAKTEFPKAESVFREAFRDCR